MNSQWTAEGHGSTVSEVLAACEAYCPGIAAWAYHPYARAWRLAHGTRRTNLLLVRVFGREADRTDKARLVSVSEALAAHYSVSRTGYGSVQFIVS